MISSVYLSGTLEEVTEPGLRYVAIDSSFPDASGQLQTHHIPVVCSRKGCLFLTAKQGSKVVLKGRLETRDNIGLVIVLEMDEVFDFTSSSTCHREHI